MSSLKFRPSLKSVVRANVLRQEAQIKAAGREVPAWMAAAADAERAAMAKEAARGPRLPRADALHKEPLERDIQKAIIQALRLHPRVIKVVRFNSGGSIHRGADGRDQLVLFSSEPVPDLFVLLKGGLSGFAWLEVKRPSFKAPRDEREERQARFLACVREAGGIGCFVRSVDEALAAIAA